MIQKTGAKRYSTGEDTSTDNNPAKKTGKGSEWWNSLFSNLGGILGGTANVISASKGNSNYYNNETGTNTEYTKKNTGLYIIIGVVVIGIITCTILLTRKK